jgi:hypothetical protein
MLASRSIRTDRSDPTAPTRQLAGAAVLAVIAFVYFAIVLAALAVRGNIGHDKEASLLSDLAPYAIALAVMHGLVAHFAMGRNPAAHVIGALISAAGAALSVIAFVAAMSGVDLFGVGTSVTVPWHAAVVLTILATLYVVAANLLYTRDPRPEA